MKNLKLFIILLIFILSSCAQTFQNNGLSEKEIENFDIEIGKTSKKYLINNYGPPIFENVFNDNVIYYVSHSTSYKTLEERKTKKMSVLEITLDNKDIVQNLKKYSEKDSYQINLSKKEDTKNIDMTSFLKDIVRALRRKDNEN
jgi:outer membrane protein assembly factor BamE (lipoprotein component of BamABCDE complex)